MAEVISALRALKVDRGDIVYVISAMWRVPGCVGPDGSIGDPSPVFYDAFREVLGPEGTVVVSTSTHNLCNTEAPFDPLVTPSHERGLFSEFVRGLPGARRSFHAFNSYTAVGARAEELTVHVSRHGYGPETPEARMIERGARFVTIGLPANIITTVHHVEHTMGVPYRYTKEFMHPVVRDGEVHVEPFYLFVWYRNADVQRSRNKRLFGRLQGRLEILEAPVGGSGRLCSLSLADFYRESIQIFKDDIYIWCAQPPAIRPYRV